MILHLFESRRARRLALGALAASVGVHAMTVGAASRPAAPRANDDERLLISIRYLLPPDRVQEPVGERIQLVAVGPGTPGWLEGMNPVAEPRPIDDGRGSERATRPAEPEDVGVEQTLATTLFTEDQVDSVAVRDPNSDGPSYPDLLREQGVQGEVLVEFAVDTTGRADPGSFSVVQASHPLFADAVRDALPRMLFTPAISRGHRVRQLVRLPMKFRLVVPEKGTA